MVGLLVPDRKLYVASRVVYGEESVSGETDLFVRFKADESFFRLGHVVQDFVAHPERDLLIDFGHCDLDPVRKVGVDLVTLWILGISRCWNKPSV